MPHPHVQSRRQGSVIYLDHNGDKRSGAKPKNLSLFGRAVLRSTPLPFIIHGSAIIKTIAYAPVAELLNVYSHTASLISSAGKLEQVLFSFDATKAYGSKGEEAAARTQVIHPDDNEALYDFSWNIKPDNLLTEGEDLQ